MISGVRGRGGSIMEGAVCQGIKMGPSELDASQFRVSRYQYSMVDHSTLELSYVIPGLVRKDLQ
jgi:hypothetical protein